MISELVSFLAAGVVKQSDDVQVTEQVKSGRVDVAIEVAPEDFGRIIGRNGQTINAIRALAGVVGEREGVQVTVDVVDPTARSRGSG